MTTQKRLRELRKEKLFESQKAFCHYAQKSGFAIDLRRYRAIERGDVTPNINDIIYICNAMGISSDAWLFSVTDSINVTGLAKKEIELVAQLVKWLTNRT